MNWVKIKHAIGWSKMAWCHPLKLFIADNKNCHFEKSLEIGASEYGSLAPFLLEVSNKITIGYFKCDVIKLNNNLNIFGCDTKAQYVDITNIDGKYDLIIVKSVLGGVFRVTDTNLNEVNKLIKRIVKNNLNGGALLMLNNGESFFESIVAKFGARKNGWRFFSSEDFVKPSHTYTFGFLSFFSFESRLGFVGKIIDHTLYFIDLFLSKITHHPAVILTVYRK
jgi:hypothetical protein